MSLSRSRTDFLIALTLILPLPLHAQSTRPTPNLVAAITLKKGSGEETTCGFSQQLQTIEIYSDGSALSSRHSRGTSCSEPRIPVRAGMMLQGGIQFPPKTFSIPPEELGNLLARLRMQQKEAHFRSSGRLNGSWEELRSAQNAQSLTISVSDDRLGSKFSNELFQVIDISTDSLKEGVHIAEEIEKLAQTSKPPR